MTDDDLITNEKIESARKRLESETVDRLVIVDETRGVRANLYQSVDEVSFTFTYPYGSQMKMEFMPLGNSKDTTIEQAYEIAKVYAEMRKHRMDPIYEAKRAFSDKIKGGWRPEMERPWWDERGALN